MPAGRAAMWKTGCATTGCSSWAGGDKGTGAGQDPPAPTDPNKAGGDKGGEKTFTQQELDRRVSDAIAKREAALKQEAEEAKLKEKQQFEQLYTKAEADRKALDLRVKTREVLEEKKLGALSPIFEQDLGTIEGRKAAAEKLGTLIEARVNELVNERLKTPTPPGKTPAGGSAGKLTPEEAGKLSFDEYEKARKEGRIG